MERAYVISSGAGNGEWLSKLDRLYDHGTIGYLDALGIGPGWRCLEAGAGTGSIARWMSGRVGPAGRVTATDIDISLMDGLDGGNLEVRQHDLSSEPLAVQEYDLVHARLVLEHLPDAEDALGKLVGATRPGGWVVVEDLDWDGAHPVSEAGADVYRRLMVAMRSVWSGGGSRPTFGQRLPDLLERHGLTDIGSEGRARIMRGGTPEANAFVGRVLIRFAPWFVSLGLLSQQEVVDGLAWADNPECAGMPAMVIAAWGRRPVEGRA